MTHSVCIRLSTLQSASEFLLKEIGGLAEIMKQRSDLHHGSIGRDTPGFCDKRRAGCNRSYAGIGECMSGTNPYDWNPALMSTSDFVDNHCGIACGFSAQFSGHAVKARIRGISAPGSISDSPEVTIKHTSNSVSRAFR